MAKVPDTIDLTEPEPLQDASSQPWTDGVETDPDTLAVYLSLPDACPGVVRRPDSGPTLLTPVGVEARVREAVATVSAKGRQRPEAATVLDLDTSRPTVLDLPSVSDGDTKDDLSPTSPTVQMQGVPPGPLAPGIYTPFLPRRAPCVPPRRVPAFEIILEYCLPPRLVRFIKRVLRKVRLLD